jgi:hypothetical protein
LLPPLLDIIGTVGFIDWGMQGVKFDNTERGISHGEVDLRKIIDHDYTSFLLNRRGKRVRFVH